MEALFHRLVRKENRKIKEKRKEKGNVSYKEEQLGVQRKGFFHAGCSRHACKLVRVPSEEKGHVEERNYTSTPSGVLGLHAADRGNLAELSRSEGTEGSQSPPDRTSCLLGFRNIVGTPPALARPAGCCPLPRRSNKQQKRAVEETDPDAMPPPL